MVKLVHHSQLLLTKDAFRWSPEVEVAFNKLQPAMSTTLVLALPDFNKMFVIKCDASGVGTKGLLMQERRSLAFTTMASAPSHMELSVYDKEMIAIVHAITKWSPHLIGRRFKSELTIKA